MFFRGSISTRCDGYIGGFDLDGGNNNNNNRRNYRNNNFHNQNNNQRHRNARALTTTQNAGAKQTGVASKCNRYGLCHFDQCLPKCNNCRKIRHKDKDCKSKNVVSGTNARSAVVCYECGERGHKSNACPKRSDRQGGNVRGQAYVIRDAEHNQGPNVVTILFHSGADKSFVDVSFSYLLDIKPAKLNTSYEVKLADGKVVCTNTVLKGCTLNLLDHLFDIDLMPIELGTFDVIIGMDWLVERDAVIVCGKKEVHVPYKNKTLVVKSHSGASRLKVISCIKARKYIERGSQLFLAQVTEKEPSKKQLQDVPVIRNFPEVFPDDFPGLPPPRQVVDFKALIPAIDFFCASLETISAIEDTWERWEVWEDIQVVPGFLMGRERWLYGQVGIIQLEVLAVLVPQVVFSSLGLPLTLSFPFRAWIYVKFMETKPWDWDNNREETSTRGSFWASFVVEGVDNGNTTQVNSENNDNTYQEQEPITAPNSPITPPIYNYNPHSEEAEEATNSSTKRSENGFDDTPVRGFKDLTKIYENAREVETENLLFTEEEPRNYKEASIDKKWIKAMEIELDSINKNNTWTLTTLPTNDKAIGLKWVYKTKRDAKGEIIKYKARLVAKGYVQEQGIDFD
ncbi:putative reverse transcriptase domain-containing protein, partial [Tanacetum coccineum]